jgi:4-amino-4-deoxy-L-arabinose transferase-like glycosyltransferase
MQPPVRRTELLLAGTVLLLAGTLRMGWPAATEFKADEARLYALALDAATGVGLPLRGIGTSVGFPNFPLSVWLYALPLWVWPHPYSAVLFTGASNTLAVAACWWLARRVFGAEAALLAALLYAASPWAIIYSRKLWAQNLLALFVMGWAASGLLAFWEQRRSWLAAHIVLLAAALQLHYSAAALALPTLGALALSYKTFDRRALLLGIGLSLGLMMPFFVYLATNPAVWSAAAAFSQPAQLDAKALQYTALIASGADIHALAGAEAVGAFQQRMPLAAWLPWLSGALLCAAFAAAWLHPTRPRSLLWWLAGWWLAPLVLFTWHATDVFPHYFITTLPAPFLLVGALLGSWLAAAPGRTRWLAWSACAAVAALQIVAWGSLLQFVSVTNTPGGFGTPAGMQLAAVTSAKALARSAQLPEILVVSDGADPLTAEDAAVFDAWLHGSAHRLVNGNANAVRPAAGAVVLVIPNATPAQELYAGWAVQTQRVPLRVGAGFIAVYALPAGGSRAALQPFAEPRTLANGVKLLGLQRTAADLQWRIVWQTGAAVNQDFHLFNHLLLADGTRVAQADAAAFSAQQWRPADEVHSFFAASAADAAAITQLRVGMYTYPDLANVPAVDALANPQADAATIAWPQAVAP